MQHRAISKFLLVPAIFLAALLPANANEFDPDKLTIKASELVPEELMSGQNYQVGEQAAVEGFMNNFSIKSDFGQFSAKSDEHLRVLIGEIAAIAELQQMSKTKAFTDSLAKSAVQPVYAAQRVVEQPVETVKQIPQGIGRLWNRTSRIVSDGAEKLGELSSESSNDGEGESASNTSKAVDAGTKFTKDQLGLNSAIRQLAKELNVDPYSTNEVLQKEMNNVAWAMAAGSFATSKISSMPSVIGDIGELDSLVWDTNPLDLQLQTEKTMSEMGADEALIKAFYDNSFYTITMRTRLIGSLLQLKSAQGKTNLIADSVQAKSELEARIYSQIAETLVAYEKARSPISNIFSGSGLPFALTQSETMVLIVPVDYLLWTELVKDAAQRTAGEMQKASSSKAQEAWIHGRVSEKAQAGLSAIGWKVFDKSPDRLH